jgi:hypothetical protein
MPCPRRLHSAVPLGRGPAGDAEPGLEAADGSRSADRPWQAGPSRWQRSDRAHPRPERYRRPRYLGQAVHSRSRNGRSPRMERCCEPVKDNHAGAIYRQMRARPGARGAGEQALLEETTAQLAPADDSLAAAATAALADVEDLPAGIPGLARSSHPASPAQRREAIAQAWRDEPGITTTALAERFQVSRRTIQHDIQALQEQGIQRPAPGRRRRSQQTRAHYAAIHQRFLAWLADELGRPPPGRISAARSSPAGSPSGRASAVTVARDYRRRRCSWSAPPCANLSARPAAPSWPPACTPPGSRRPHRRPSHPPSTSGCSLSPT